MNADRGESDEAVRRARIARGKPGPGAARVGLRSESESKSDVHTWASSPPKLGRDRESQPRRGPAATTPPPVVDDAGAERVGRAADAPDPSTPQSRKPDALLRARISASRKAGGANIGSTGDRRPSEAIAVCETCGGTFLKKRAWARFCCTRCRMIRHGRIRPSKGAE